MDSYGERSQAPFFVILTVPCIPVGNVELMSTGSGERKEEREGTNGEKGEKKTRRVGRKY